MLKIKPISVNEAWQGRRYKTEIYKAYEEQLLWMFKGYKECKPCGLYGIVIKWASPNALKSDIDNVIKPFMDCLVKSGIVKDDRYCNEMHIEKIKSKDYFIEFNLYSI